MLFSPGAKPLRLFILTPILAFLSICWFISSKMAPDSTTDLQNTGNIKSIDAEYGNKKLYLNIHLKQDTSCKEIMKALAIQPVDVKGKTYSPSCAHIDDTLLKITYVQVVEV